MKKLKSIKQLLTEYPDAYFGISGNLYIDMRDGSNVGAIWKEHLHKFGKDTDMDFPTIFYEPEPRTEAEKPEKKRLYAYKKTENFIKNIDEIGNPIICESIEWFTNTNIDSAQTNLERAPEFDERFN